MLRAWQIIFLLYCLVSPVAGFAYLVGAEILPSNPTSNDFVIARILDNPHCLPLVPNQDGQNHDVTFVDNVVKLDLVYSGLCVQPTPQIDEYEFPLGYLSSGTYTLKIFEVSTSTSFPADADDRVLIEEIEFGISNPPTAIPALNQVGILFLILLFLAMSIKYWNRRSRHYAHLRFWNKGS